MRRFFIKPVICLLTLCLIIGFSLPVLADSGINDTNVIDEKFGMPIVVYGDNLTESQKQEVRELLEVTNPDTVKEYSVTGQDIAKYINGNPDSNMFSSAKIVRKEAGYGIRIRILTPKNITKVTDDMYANALLTAGVEDAFVDVVSPVKVTGHSALTGIYKAYDAEGEQLNKERMEIANEELDVATDLAEKSGMTQEKVSELLTEIKKAIAEQNPATKEDVERIVKEQIDKLDIKLNEADREMLINLFEKMRDLNIDFDKVKSQLEDLASTIKDKADQLGLDEGFWEKVTTFFKDILNAIGNFFEGLFK